MNAALHLIDIVWLQESIVYRPVAKSPELHQCPLPLIGSVWLQESIVYRPVASSLKLSSALQHAALHLIASA